MGCKSCLLLLAFFCVLGLMAGKGMADAESERVHKLPNDERLKRSGEQDGGAEGVGADKMGNLKEEVVDADVGGGGDGEKAGSTVEPGGEVGSGKVFKKDEVEPGGNNGDNQGIAAIPATNPGNEPTPPPSPPAKPGNEPAPPPSPPAKPGNEPAPPPSPPTKPGDQEVFDPLHANFFAYYDSKTGQCYYGKTMEEAKEKRMLANGKILVHDENALPVCVADFDKVAKLRSCGLPKYDEMVYCIKVQFYGGDVDEGKKRGLEAAKNLMEMNNPTTLDEYKEHYMQSNIFVFVDGCIKCKEGGKYTVQFYQIHPVGPIEKICPGGEEMLNGGMEKTIKNGDTANYMTGSMLKERLCISRENMSVEAKMDLTYKYNAKMVIMHNCGGEESKHTILFETTIEKGMINYNVFHLRNVQINLYGKTGETSETISWDWKDKKKGLGYFYYEPKDAQENVVVSDGSISFGEQDMQNEMNMDLPDLQFF